MRHAGALKLIRSQDFAAQILVSTGDILLLATHITFSNHFKPVIYIHNYFHAHFHLFTFKGIPVLPTVQSNLDSMIYIHVLFDIFKFTEFH